MGQVGGQEIPLKLCGRILSEGGIHLSNMSRFFQQPWENLTRTCFYLYILSLPLSMAGMETFSWASLATFAALSVQEYRRTGKNLWIKTGADLPLLAFWGVVAIGALVLPGMDWEERFYILGVPRWILLLYVFTAILAHSLVSIDHILKVLFGCAVVVSIYAIIQAFTGIDIFRKHSMYESLPYVSFWRAKGFFTNAMTFAHSFGILLCFFVPYFLWRGSSRSFERKVLNWFGLLIFAMAVTFSLTRGLWFAVFTALMVMSLFKSKRIFLGVIIGIGVVFSLSYFYIDTFRMRINTTFDRSSAPVKDRLDLWRSNWVMFKENPVLGVGLNHNGEIVQEYHLKVHGREAYVSHAHNNYLQILAGTGFLGFLAYISLIFMCFYMAIRGYFKMKKKGGDERLFIGAVGALTCFHVGGLTEANLVDGEVTHAHMFILSLLFAAYYKIRIDANWKNL